MQKSHFEHNTRHAPVLYILQLDIVKHTLKPYMASVNHNCINEITWLNIVHTLIGFVSKVMAKTTQRRWKTWVMMLVLLFQVLAEVKT